MSVLEEKDSGFRVQHSEKKGPSPSFLNPEPRTPNPTRRFATYFTRYGWIHALLLLSVWLFLFPFLWMVSTSVKTDDELTAAAVLPEIPTFRPSSPYVRPIEFPKRPIDAPVATWNALLPKLSDITTARIAAYQKSHPAQASFVAFDPAPHRA